VAKIFLTANFFAEKNKNIKIAFTKRKVEMLILKVKKFGVGWSAPFKNGS
jgi:hypothetical protein